MAGTKIRKTIESFAPALSHIGLWLVLALLVRLALAYWQYSGDIRNHWVWGEGVLRSGASFFQQQFSGFNQPNYPSLTLYFFAAGVGLYQLFQAAVELLNSSISLFPSGLVWLTQHENFRLMFVKLPAILADLGCGWMIYKLLPPKSRIVGALLFLFNPAIIYVSTVWGQVESIPVFFILAAILHTRERSLILASLAYAAAVLSKQTALWTAPFFIIWWWQEFGYGMWKGILLQLGLVAFSFLPLGMAPINALGWYLGTLSGSSTLVSDSAWNLWHWWFGGKRVGDDILLGPLSVRVWSLITLGLTYGLLAWKQLARHKEIAGVLFLVSLAAFFLQTRVHERHLFPALAFLLLVGIPANAKYMTYAVISLYFLANLMDSLRLPFI